MKPPPVDFGSLVRVRPATRPAEPGAPTLALAALLVESWRRRQEQRADASQNEHAVFVFPPSDGKGWKQ